MPPNAGSAQEIAHGKTVTDADGGFTVTFTAKPDLSVPWRPKGIPSLSDCVLSRGA